jgi:hypothetical protein
MKKTAVLSVLILLSLTAVSGAASGQDLRYWEVFGIGWKPLPGLRLVLEKQLRYEGTFTDLENDISELSVGYKLQDWLELQADYRFISQSGEKRNRLDGAVELSRRWRSIELSSRSRLQAEFITNSTGQETETTFRERIQATFRRDKALQPYISGEIFLGLGEGGKAQNKYRLTAGADYDVTKKASLGLFGVYQKDLSEKTNESYGVLGGRFRYTF